MPVADGSGPVMARTLPYAWLLLVTGVLGWLASGDLALEMLARLADPRHAAVCDISPWVSCGEVMGTWQGSVAGFPNMLIGVVAFTATTTTAMGILAGARLPRWYWAGLQVGVTVGFAFTAWLWSQALYAIGVLCPLCMVVWAVMVPLFVWTSIRNLHHGVVPAPGGLVTLLGEWGWAIVALLYAGLAASILVRFLPMLVPSTM